ncbi:Uncharacterized protein PCOAH_00013120 [Plasmodium coatneyi]|uniref:KIR protein n=1 Tax=Plasmodium coatneyi TaxID=208452 RepID=A0A1B1DW50_9APIC|nr:Uncharacterized protein PCOAH_00013120 [Plasmodium coatneyi]ANQ06988.1 Uncharacterized protein PCOAH_00013120 [Plasmodium coatneyi]
MEDPSEELPSQKIYNEVKGSSCYSEHSSIFHGKRSQLERNPKIQQYAKQIIEALCYLSKNGGGYKLNNDRCKFLYWLIGSAVVSNLGGKNFSNLMSEIYNTLYPYIWIDGCTSPYYISISKELFSHLKVLHDFHHDEGAIKAKLLLLQARTDSKKHPYCARIQQVISAYEAVQSDCDDGKTSTKKYCHDLKTKYKGYSEEGLSQVESKCDSMTEAGEKATTTSIKLTKTHLEMLTSYVKYYKQFTVNPDYCYYCNFPSRKKIYDKLKAYFDDDKYANIIARALCYVSTKAKEEKEKGEEKEDEEEEEEEEGPKEEDEGVEKPNHEKRCKFFNFWLGHLLYKKLNDNSKFSEVIGVINTELDKISEEHKCELPITNIDNATGFNNRRIVYEYFIDHAKITKQLNISDSGSPTSSSKPKCDKAYCKHLTNITTAYNALKDECNGKVDGFCGNFNSTYKTLIEKDLSKLTCQLEEGEGEEGGDDPLLPPSSSLSKVAKLPEDDDPTGICTEQLMEEATISGANTTAAPIVSSVFGTLIGIPAIALFLYKYTSLPSLLHAQFKGGGGGRNNSSVSNIRKRTTTASVESDFDDDTSIIGGSTTEYDSTIGDSSTIYSVPYVR